MPTATEPAGLLTVLAAERNALGIDIPGEPVAGGSGQSFDDSQVVPIGLALSGGGIRSATFCLGVLQALAKQDKLASFDYLSTVSGGGYIGSWLTAWVARKGLKAVQESLKCTGAASGIEVPTSAEPTEVAWLRRYSNYLTPRLGIFSLDSLTLVATWARNVALNATVLLSVLTAIFVLPYLLLTPFDSALHEPMLCGFSAACTGIIFFSGIAYNLWHQGLPPARRNNWLITPSGVITTVIAPGIVTAWLAAGWLFGPVASGDSDFYPAAYALGLSIFLLLLWTIFEVAKRRDLAAVSGRDRWWEVASDVGVYVLAAVVSLGVGALVLSGLRRLLADWANADPTPVLVLSLGMPVLLGLFGVMTTVFTGLAGRVYYERSREWWSRLNAWFAMLSVTWVLWTLCAFLALPLLLWLRSRLGGWMSLLGAGWIGTMFTAVLARKPRDASEKLQIRVDSALNIAATVFVAGLLFVVAAAATWCVFAAASVAYEPAVAPAALSTTSLQMNSDNVMVDYHISSPSSLAPTLRDYVQAHLLAVAGIRALHFFGLSYIWIEFLLICGVALLFGWRVDINKFSIHNMYKNRLIRCYLGASNQERRSEQPFVGLDDCDDMALTTLSGIKQKECDDAENDCAPQKPFHLINTTLNISQGSNLAWQERKGASFVFTPLMSGFSLEKTQGDGSNGEGGYRPTNEYATEDHEENGFTLGMAMATSGAAVSPNMGHATQPARAFVLTLFNLRLGRWSANPARGKWRRPAPRFGIVPLIQELLGYSNENRNFVYLSDGGHFDNLGIYELVRRRCKVIFAVDAGQDSDRSMADLGEAVRKCRVDLGVELVFPDATRLTGDEKMRSESAYVLGSICYDDVRENDGQLVLIKPSMHRGGGEPIDVINYSAQNSSFPQETTADQFFSESQFESYRRLGMFIAQACLQKHGALLPLRIPPDQVRIRPKDAAPPPTFPTRVIGVLSRRERKDLPDRAGALIDFFILFFIITLLALFVVFPAFDLIVFHRLIGGPCFTLHSCEAALTSMIDAGDKVAFFKNPLAWRTFIDNVFVLIYLGTFVIADRIALKPRETSRRRKLAIWLLTLSALVTATADFGENIGLLAGLARSSFGAIPAVVAPFSTVKFISFFANVALRLPLTHSLWGAYKKRWKGV